MVLLATPKINVLTECTRTIIKLQDVVYQVRVTTQYVVSYNYTLPTQLYRQFTELCPKKNEIRRNFLLRMVTKNTTTL
jgi:hypothetical protein